MRGPALLTTVTLLIAAPAHAATAACQSRTAEMREALQRTSTHLTGPIEIPSMVADWVRDLVRRYDAEKDPARRAALVSDAWPKAFAHCKEPFARAFAGASSLEPAAKVKHLQRAIPDAFLACGCEGADPDAIEVLSAMAVRDVLRDERQREAEVERAAAPKKLEDVIRKGGSIYRIAVAGGQPPRCEATRFRHEKSPWTGRLGPFDYRYADGTLTLSGPKGKTIGLGCVFQARVGAAGPDAVTIDNERVFLTAKACEAARANAPTEPVRHMCPW